MGKYATHYTNDELRTIKEQWLKNKKQVDEKMEGLYHRDKDKEYEKYLCNQNLRRMFNFAAYLFRALQDAEVSLYTAEEALVSKVYTRILNNGYYDQSKEEEKRTRRRLGIAVRRQYWLKYKRRG